MGVGVSGCIFIGNFMLVVFIFWNIYVFGGKTIHLYTTNDIQYSTDDIQKYMLSTKNDTFIYYKNLYINVENNKIGRKKTT